MSAPQYRRGSSRFHAILKGMRNLTSPSWITFKGILFLVLGALSGLLLISEQPTLKVALLLAVTVWSFCRFYYFLFYVMERYVDPSYRFSGLWSLAVHLLRKSR